MPRIPRPSLPRPSLLRPSLPRPGRVLARVALTGAVCTALAGGTVLASGAGPLAVPAALALPSAQVFEAVEAAGDRPADGSGVNFLLLGIDRRAGMTKAEKDRLHVNGEGCDCTDVMMLVHVAEDRRRISVVSIPRDSYVPFPQDVDRAELSGPLPKAGKINGAYKVGGASLTVRTVEQATGIRVDHYLEADFGSFVRTIDRLGGATVCTDKPLRDKNAGLRLTTGTHHLDGRRALRYVRARHIAPSGDLGRVRRQQRLLAELFDHYLDTGMFRDPAALLRTARALHGSLRVDERLTIEQLMSLGRALRGLTTERAEFASVPISEFDHRVEGWGSTLVWDRERAAKLFSAVREDRTITSEEAYAQPAPGVPVEWAPKDIPVHVRTSPGREAAAARLAEGLRENGFDVRERPARTEAGDSATAAGDSSAPEAPARTLIVYDPARLRQAKVLATALPEAELRPVEGHSKVFEVRPGPAAEEPVTRIVHDRSSVQGAPVTGDELDCDGAPAAAG